MHRENIKSGHYVLVEFQNYLRNKCHYTAQIDDISEDGEFNTTYLEKKRSKFDHKGSVRFMVPESSKSYKVPFKDIIIKLLNPKITEGSKRISGQITFQFHFKALIWLGNKIQAWLFELTFLVTVKLIALFVTGILNVTVK